MIGNAGRNADRPLIALVQGAILVVTLIMMFCLWTENQYTAAFTRSLCVLFSLHFVWCLWSWGVMTGRWFDGYIMFYLSLCLFSGGHFFLETFGLNRDGILYGAFTTETVNRTILLVNVAVAAYHFGGIVYVLRKARDLTCSQASPLHRGFMSFSTQRAKAIGLLFLFASLPATWLTMINSVSLVLSGGYMKLYQQELLVGVDNWRVVLSTFTMPGILITFAMFHESRLWVKGCWAFTVVYVAINMFMGSRGAAVLIGAPMLLLHHSIVKKIRPAFLITGCLGAFILFSIISQTRNMRLEDRYFMLEQPLTDNLVVSAISEMGGSAGTIAYTTELVPENRPHDYGIGYTYAFLTVVPNLFWERHISAQWGSYSNWLVWTVEPGIASRGGGLGFSVVAEAYANFSVFGPPLVMTILGFVIAAISSATHTTKLPFIAAMEAIFISAVLILPRAETASIFRPLLWFCVIPWLFSVRGRENLEIHDFSVLSNMPSLR